MAVLSRHEGSPSSATSAQTLVDHIQDLLLPRILPYLQRLTREEERRQRERELRQEQDRAYERAAAADAERVRKAREAERRRKEEERRAEAERKREEEKAKQYALWRRWARHNLVVPPPSDDVPASEKVKIAVRLPSGTRLDRYFAKSDKIEALFVYVETYEQGGEEDAEEEQGRKTTSAPPSDFHPTYRFSLVTGYPRAKIEADAITLDQAIGAHAALKDGGILLAEGQVGLHKARTIDTTDEESEEAE